MKSKEEIVHDWLPRYTGLALEDFTPYILLTNFSHYLELFAEKFNVPIQGLDKPISSVRSGGITMLNFGMGSPMAATVMDLLTAVSPKAVLFLGKGTSSDYFPPEVPALPSFALQKALSTTIRDLGLDYWTGTVYTTNRRVWEHDKVFKAYLQKIRAMAIDMETATLFSVGFYNGIPSGALLLVSDQPMIPEGVKTGVSDRRVTAHYAQTHLDIGIQALNTLINNGLTVKHLRF
jgi:AMP nucleosidase